MKHFLLAAALILSAPAVMACETVTIGDLTIEHAWSKATIGAGRPGVPLEALVEVMRETRRLVFLRGTVVQGDGDEHLVASFSGIVRKPSGK